MSTSDTPSDRGDITRGLAPDSADLNHRGLDLSNLTSITPEEAAAFKAHYSAQFGIGHQGLDWWIERNAEVLKRYRLLGSLSLRVEPAQMGHGYIGLYALLGFEVGVRYCIVSQQKSGLNRTQSLETIALAFVQCGPRGMYTIARALEGYEFVETPEVAPRFPPGWEPDIEAFRSGVDFSKPTLTSAEKRLIEEWYERNLGEVPPSVRFLGRYRPELLKAYRGRFENTLYTLPKQYWPTTMLFFSCLWQSAPGIRENVLLCRAFGVSKQDTLTIIGNSLVYGDLQQAALAEEVAADVFDSWPD